MIHKNGFAVTVGTDIYLFGGENTNDYNPIKTSYKYNTLTDTYTKLSDIPCIIYEGAVTAIDTDIYLFGGRDSDGTTPIKTSYKYNTLDNTFVKLEDMPYQIQSGSAVTVGTDIYLLSVQISPGIYGTCKYITYKQYEQIDKYKYNNVIIKSQMPSNVENGNIYILYGNTYTTKLLKKVKLDFANVFLYEDEEIKEYPVYYGNGQEWIKI